MRSCPDDPTHGALQSDGTWWRCQACGISVTLPNPGFQEDFVSCNADILLAASGSGTGKTRAMLMAAARFVGSPGYRGILLRQQKEDLSKPDGLIDQARDLYETIGGEWNEGASTFRFPCRGDGESSIKLGHVGRNYRDDYQGPAAAFLGIDELTQIPEDAFRWFFSRLRSAAGVPVRVRAICNPDGDSWILPLLAQWWIGPDGVADPTRAGKRRYLAGRDGEWHWGDTWQDAGRLADRPRRDVLSVEYMEAYELAAQVSGGGYEGRKGLLSREDAESLSTDRPRWVRRKSGKLLQPEHLAREMAAAPPGTIWIRCWDLAATDESFARSGTSYTAGILIGLSPQGEILIGDALIGRWSAAEVERRVMDTARRDGRAVPIRFCKERAGAGKRDYERFVRLLAGWDVGGEVESGPKDLRLRPFVAAAEAGNVYLLSGARAGQEVDWRDRYRSHMLGLSSGPDGGPDDAGDATAQGLQWLTGDLSPSSEQVESDVAAWGAAAAALAAPSAPKRGGGGFGGGGGDFGGGIGRVF